MELAPSDVQDMACQTIDDVHEDCELNIRLFRGSPTRCQFATALFRWTSDGWTGEEGDSTFEFGVDTIGNKSQRCNCGGWGHASRECPSDRGRQRRQSERQGQGSGQGSWHWWKGRRRRWDKKEKPKGTKARAIRVAKLDTRLGSAAHATPTQSRKRARERWRRWWTLERSGTWGTWRMSM